MPAKEAILLDESDTNVFNRQVKYPSIADSIFIQNLIAQGLFNTPEYSASYVRGYVLENELTALMEAVYKEHITFYDNYFDEDRQDFMSASGAFSHILKKGVLAIDERIKHETRTDVVSALKIERDRRRAELAEHELFLCLLKNGRLNDSFMLTISPFPDEMVQISPETAQDIGYSLQERTWKIRFVYFDSLKKMRRTVEIFAPRSSVEKIGAFAQDLFNVEIKATSTTDILNNPFLVNMQHFPSERELFEKCLLRIYGDAHSIIQQSEYVKDIGSESAERLALLSLELGKSLAQGFPTEYIRSQITGYLNIPVPIISDIERKELEFALFIMTHKAAAIIKKLATVTEYKAVEYAIDTGDYVDITDNWIIQVASQPVEYSACGFTTDMPSYTNPYKLPFEAFENSIFTKNRKIVACPGFGGGSCGKILTIDGAKIKNCRGIRCPFCGLTSKCPEAIYNSAKKQAYGEKDYKEVDYVFL